MIDRISVIEGFQTQIQRNCLHCLHVLLYWSSLKISLLKSNGGAKGLYSGASQFLTLGGTVISQLLRIVSMTKEM